MLRPGIPRSISAKALEPFFLDLVHRSFTDLAVSNQEIITYIVNLLVRFSRTDALYRIQEPHGKRLETVAEILIEANELRLEESAGLDRERDVRQHVGDYSMFMSGIFRTYLEGHGFLDLYLKEGEKAYRETANLDRKLYRPGASRFDLLSNSFEQLSGALDYMRKVYFGSAILPGSLRSLSARFNCWN